MTQRLLVLLLFALSTWLANRDVCPSCALSDIELLPVGGAPIHARLYLPRAGDGLAAVVVCHGYLANRAFLEIPWAADLTRLGAAALLLDRHGHGRSGGSWWPPDRDPSRTAREPDVAAALHFLRSQSLIDPRRLAVVGHSDGGTAAITAGSFDWGLRATVAVSASVAPLEYVNHAVPRNLLLVYGEDDRFVLHDTESMLIANSTRGHLVGPGELGDIDDGSARRLLRVRRRGHVDLLYDDGARREVLGWLRRSLQPPGEVTLSGSRLIWVWSGLAAIVVSLLLGAPAAREASSLGWRLDWESRRYGAALFVGWTVGALWAVWLAPRLAIVPTREGAVFAAVLLGPASCLIAGLKALTALDGSGRMWRRATHTRELLGEVLWGGASAAITIFAIDLLVAHHYESSLPLPRAVLWMVFFLLAAPLFLTLEEWLYRLSGGVAGACVLGLGGVMMLVSLACFERMSVVPGCLLAAVTVLYGAYRSGSFGRNRPVACALFGSLLLGRVAAAVCVFY